MNILFIKSSIGSSLLPSFDMGIASMSAILKRNGHRVNYFSYDSWEASKALFTRINLFNPLVVGLSVTASTFNSAVKVAKQIKMKFPKITIIMGGVHPTIFPECIYVSQSIDAICLGEGEYVLLDFIRNLKKNDGSHVKTIGFWVRNKRNKIIKNPTPTTLIDVNTLPIPDRSIFLDESILKFPREYYHNRFGLEFIFSRGCPFECTYCSNHALKKFYGPRFVRFKSPRQAIKEIRYVMKHYRYDYFRFHDDTFTVNSRWLSAFLNEYSKIKVPFQCNIRADLCNKELFKKMKNVGCEEVLIGVESGDDEIRMKMLNKRISTSVFKQAFSWAKEVGLKTTAFVLIGLPDETPKKFINTIKFLSEVEADELFLYVYYPYPGTKLYSYCLSKGYLNTNSNQINVLERKDTILTMPEFSRQDILYYYNNFSYLVDLAKNIKNRKKKLGKVYNRLIFFLATQPPSSKSYLLSKAVLKFIDLVISTAIFSISLVLKV